MIFGNKRIFCYIAIIYFLVLSWTLSAVETEKKISPYEEHSSSIILPSFFNEQRVSFFYGNELNQVSILGGYGGFEVLLETNPSSIFAFIEIGGGIQLNSHPLLEDESFSFVKFGSRYLF